MTVDHRAGRGSGEWNALSADRGIALATVGPADHGITRLSGQIASAAIDSGFQGTVVVESDPAALESLADRLPPAVRLLHVHTNDWLFGTENCTAGDRFASLAGRLADRGIRLSLTLHDLPQPSDGPALNGRRTANYQTMLSSSVGAVVSSDHERRLLFDAWGTAGSNGADARSIDVIPLPIDRLPVAPAETNRVGLRTPTVGIFGYLYPGKGHREVLEELAEFESAITLLAIGRPSERHNDLLPELEMVARLGGTGFRCTGYLPDSEVPGQLRRATIPVAPHTHVSASGSINSWLAAGRRPLVPSGRYVSELDRRMPGAVWIYPPGKLREFIKMALAEPKLTLLPPRLEVGPSTTEVAGQYLHWLRRRVGLLS